MPRQKLYGIRLPALLLVVLVLQGLPQDRQSEATAVSDCSDLASGTSEISRTAADNSLPMRILTPSRGADEGCEERLVRLGRYHEAIEAYKKMLKVKRHDAVSHNNLCVAYLLTGHYEDGITACSEALRIEPRLADANSNLAMGLSLIGNYRKAAEAYHRAIKINPQFAEAHNNLGVAYNRLGRYSKAIKAFEQSLRIKPGFAEAHYNLACSYLALSDQKSALAEYRILGSLDGGLAKTLLDAISDTYKFKAPAEEAAQTSLF